MSTNYTHGHEAEQVAAEYLDERGFRIREMNWKTKWCEIDIIAEKDKAVYMVEVKYRKTTDQGRGIEYITPSKLKQMQFAAEMWVGNNDWQGEYQLAVIEVYGDDFEVTDFVTNI